ncbi:MAG: DUF882 domain-containing protein [Acidobacteriota bacterium]|nr:DUF882 domain-containing protein [Acidobacteriota bacterium]
MDNSDRRHSFDRRATNRRHSSDRRHFLRAGAAAAAVLALPSRLKAVSPAASAAPVDAVAAAATVPAGAVAPAAANRSLSFVHTHTREKLAIQYCCNGRYEPEALARLNHLLRDFRTNQMKPIDPKLFDLLHDLSDTLDTDEPYHIISGFRSPLTNSMLQTRGGSHTGVATNSLHMVGKAMDIRVPAVKLKTLREAAASLKRGGVGFYPASDFVHVDTGRVRYW